jgi:hypothetical protein
METKQNKLDELKGKNPFKLPEGYLEGLTEQIMSRLPDQIPETPKVISLYDRIRPLLYLAGVFVGLLLLFRVFIQPDSLEKETFGNDPLYVQATVSGEMLHAVTEEDQEYLDYLNSLENEYYNNAFAEEMDYTE